MEAGRRELGNIWLTIEHKEVRDQSIQPIKVSHATKY